MTGSSIITELSAFGEGRKLLGLHPLRVAYSTGEGRSDSLDLVAKVKPLDEEVIVETGKLASLCGAQVAEAWSRWGEHTEFKDLHTRELAIYRAGEPRLAAVLARIRTPRSSSPSHSGTYMMCRILRPASSTGEFA